MSFRTEVSLLVTSERISCHCFYEGTSQTSSSLPHCCFSPQPWGILLQCSSGLLSASPSLSCGPCEIGKVGHYLSLLTACCAKRPFSNPAAVLWERPFKSSWSVRPYLPFILSGRLMVTGLGHDSSKYNPSQVCPRDQEKWVYQDPINIMDSNLTSLSFSSFYFFTPLQ